MLLAVQVAEGLRTLMLGLYDVHLAPDGRSVDYPALVRDPNFADYTTAATELQKVSARGPCLRGWDFEGGVVNVP